MCKVCGNPEHELNGRRQFLRRTLAGVAALTLTRAYAEQAPAGVAAPNAIAPKVALQRLLDGNARYVSAAPVCTDSRGARATLVNGQYPIAAVLGCADSRVAPELAFDQGPGDLFVTRVAGNVVAEELLASLEYGVQFLGLPLVMVLGHSGCGAVSAAIKVIKDGAQLPGHLPALIEAIKPAVRAVNDTPPAGLLDAAIAANVQRQVGLLKTESAILGEYFKAGKIDIVGAVYALDTGKVTLL